MALKSDDIRELVNMAEEKLNASKELLGKRYYSDAVSRAYYSMYCSSRALLSSKNLYPRTHKGLISQIWENFVKEGHLSKDRAKALASAQDDREDADYGIYIHFTKEEAEQVVKDAEEFLSETKKILESQTKK